MNALDSIDVHVRHSSNPLPVTVAITAVTLQNIMSDVDTLVYLDALLENIVRSSNGIVRLPPRFLIRNAI